MRRAGTETQPTQNRPSTASWTSLRRQALGKSARMDHWAIRYPTNVSDVARVLVDLSRSSSSRPLLVPQLTEICSTVREEQSDAQHRSLLSSGDVHQVRHLPCLRSSARCRGRRQGEHGGRHRWSWSHRDRETQGLSSRKRTSMPPLEGRGY